MSETENENKVEKRDVSGLMVWIRILLPMILAAFGWYVGNIVGKFESSIVELSKEVNIQKVEMANLNSYTIHEFNEIDRRLNLSESRNEENRKDHVEKDEYIRQIDELKQSIKDLETQKKQ